MFAFPILIPTFHSCCWGHLESLGRLASSSPVHPPSPPLMCLGFSFICSAYIFITHPQKTYLSLLCLIITASPQLKMFWLFWFFFFPFVVISCLGEAKETKNILCSVYHFELENFCITYFYFLIESMMICIIPSMYCYFTKSLSISLVS